MAPQDPKSIFKEYCRKKGMRYTPERAIVIDEIYRRDVHFDIDSLFLSIRTRHPNLTIAKASIYRTIPHLIKSGLIRESFYKHRHACYEHVLGHAHHDHMRCVGCGKVFEFFEVGIDEAQQALCRRRKFTMLWHNHVIVGYCAQCQRKEKEKKRAEGVPCKKIDNT